MVLTIKCFSSRGIELRGLLKRMKLYDDTYQSLKTGHLVYLPIRKPSKEQEKELLKEKVMIVSKDLRKTSRTRSFRRALQKVLPANVYTNVSRSYEQVGTIGILTIDDEQYEEVIAKTLIETNKGISTVVKKSSHKGKLRQQSYVHLTGIKTTKTIHKESGIELVVDIAKTYFSARTFEERKRIASLIRKGENVLVMFSGIAPYLLVISKNAEVKKIVGVELSKESHKMAVENVERNAVKNVELIQGDVRNIASLTKDKFDRIVMPHPSEADSFLNEAFSVATANVTLHIYHFSKQEKKDVIEEKIYKAAKKKNFTIISINTIEQQKISPTAYKYCYDVVARKK